MGWVLFSGGRFSPFVNRSVSETSHNSIVHQIAAPFGLLLLTLPGFSQDIEPRRWSHLPIGANFLGTACAYGDGEISFNPVLRIEEGEFDLETAAVQYIRSFEILGKSARVDVTQPFQSGTWSGLLDGVPTSVDRVGWADSFLRFAVNLYGAPPLAGKEFADHRVKTDCETIVGLGMLMQLPTGEYLEDKLINLGSNRYTFTPQLGLVHNRGNWSAEVTTSASFHTDNDEFFNGKTLEQDPYFIGQAHLSYTFRPGLWLCASTGYGYGGESTINGTAADDRKGNLAWGLSMGIPVNRAMGFKLAYVGARTQEDTGADSDTFSLGFSVMW